MKEKDRFIRRIKDKYGKIKFVGVYELQENRNSWHIHIIIKFCNYKSIFIDNENEMEAIWGIGNTKTSYITNKVEEYEINEEARMDYHIYEEFPIVSAAKYISKIRTKESIPKNKRAFFSSRNVVEPEKFKTRYCDIVQKLDNEYCLSSQQTTLVINDEKNKLLNAVTVEQWKRRMN